MAGLLPAPTEITAGLRINIDPPSPPSDLAVRRHVTAYLNVPVYRAFQEWLGGDEAPGAVWGAWQSGGREGGGTAGAAEGLEHLIIPRSNDVVLAPLPRHP